MSRQEFAVEELPVTVVCPTCGRETKLYFNGGELDMADCHRTKWTLKHEGIVLVTEYDDGIIPVAEFKARYLVPTPGSWCGRHDPLRPCDDDCMYLGDDGVMRPRGPLPTGLTLPEKWGRGL